MPIRKRTVQGIDPLANSCFSRMNLLATANETYDDYPIVMSIHTGDQELWFGVNKVENTFSSLQEISCLGLIPRTLCFIIKRNMFNRRPGVFYSLISELVNRLNECPNLTTRLANSKNAALFEFARNAIAR